MRQRVKDRMYSVDEPDEISLTKEFSFSRMTMKRALDVSIRIVNDEPFVLINLSFPL
ncbi:hypothetical protein [Bacillus fonticola]|uniref:hypothetical protein n=1 Tax=Bacillus fonticola TaxID=2728853 RepID=UPI003898D5EB